jgi:hypothetical protein
MINSVGNCGEHAQICTHTKSQTAQKVQFLLKTCQFLLKKLKASKSPTCHLNHVDGTKEGFLS